MRFTAEIDGAVEMDRAFNRVQTQIEDFRFIWPSVAEEVYAIEKEQFASQGAHGASGRWRKLSPAYAKWKAKKFPGQPILQLYGHLIASLTNKEAPGAVFISQPKQLTIGSKIPYAVVHQRTGRPPFSYTEGDKRRIQKSIQLPLVRLIRQQGFEVIEKAA